MLKVILGLRRMELKPIIFLSNFPDGEIMSNFTDFDANYGNGYYSEMPVTDTESDVLHNGSVVNEHNSELLTFKNGDLVLRSNNAATGEEQVIVSGKIVQTSRDNIFGGENIYDGSNELKQLTIPNEYGGIDIYDGDMQQLGSTLPNVYGGEDYLARETNVNYIMDYQDPLVHSGEYVMNPFYLTK